MKLKFLIFFAAAALALLSCTSTSRSRTLEPYLRDRTSVIDTVEAVFEYKVGTWESSTKNLDKKAFEVLLEAARERYPRRDIDVVNIKATYPDKGGLIRVYAVGEVIQSDNVKLNTETYSSGNDMYSRNNDTYSRNNEASSQNKKNDKELEKAIGRISKKLIDELPKKAVIAVINVNPNSRETSQAMIIESLEYYLVNAKKFTIVDRHTLDAIRSEQRFQMSGEVSDASVVEIGELAGASVVITGKADKDGKSWRLVTKALDVKSGRILAMVKDPN